MGTASRWQRLRERFYLWRSALSCRLHGHGRLVTVRPIESTSTPYVICQRCGEVVKVNTERPL